MSVVISRLSLTFIKLFGNGRTLNEAILAYDTWDLHHLSFDSDIPETI